MTEQSHETHGLIAAAESFCDFIAQNIDPSLNFEPSQLEKISSNLLLNDSLSLAGSHIKITTHNSSLVLYVFATADALYYLAQRILAVPKADELSAADVTDAINEVANVLAGGVKNRLSSEYAAELLLGLPEPIEPDFIKKLKNDSSLGMYSFEGKNIYFHIQVSD